MTPLEIDIHQTANRLWTKRTIAGRVRKLGEEFGELAEALIEYIAASNAGATKLGRFKGALRAEAGDVGIVLSDLCTMAGFSLEAAMRDKLKRNKAKAARKAKAPRPILSKVVGFDVAARTVAVQLPPGPGMPAVTLGQWAHIEIAEEGA